jgi:hypothetical protein
MIKTAAQSSILNDARYSSMSGGYAASSEYLIESRIIDNPVSSVVFNNLSQYAGVYRHLQIIITARSNRNDTFDAIGLRINDVSTNDYAAHYLASDGATVFSSAEVPSNRILIGNPDAATAEANVFSAQSVEILDAFSTTKNTIVRALSGSVANRPRVFLHSGVWLNTASIASITLFSTTANAFVQGSRFSIYGVTA